MIKLLKNINKRLTSLEINLKEIQNQLQSTTDTESPNSLNLRQAQEYLKLDENEILSLIKNRTVPFFESNNHYYFNKIELRDWHKQKLLNVLPDLSAEIIPYLVSSILEIESRQPEPQAPIKKRPARKVNSKVRNKQRKI